MKESIEIGKETAFGNGFKIFVEELNPVETNPNQGRVPLAEAAHVVIDPDNVEYVDGNITKIRAFNPVQAAAHHGDGDGHDRFITEMSGSNYDAAAISADAILSTKQDQVIAIAGEMNRRGGRISGSEARKVIERVKSGPTFRITAITPDGKTHQQVEKGVKNEIVIVDFNKLDKAA